MGTNSDMQEVDDPNEQPIEGGHRLRGQIVEVPPRQPVLRRYERAIEHAPATHDDSCGEVISYADAAAAIASSALSPGGQALLRGLLRTGHTAVFPGGGIGIEYGSLLKTASRPDYLAPHIHEAAEHLRERRVDLLVVPGMSGYPVGAMYALGASIPAILLKKQKHQPERDPADYPPGSFVIPSYTGDGDVVMSADVAAMRDIVDTILRAQLDRQREVGGPELSLHVAGADDIIDKATMSQAVSESALVVGRAAMADFRFRYRRQSGDSRPMRERIEVVAWVTPLIKGYNRPQEHLQRLFGVTPFAGLNVTSVHLDPPAIGIEGVGVVAFAGQDE